ncbi:MAG: hypothetical protein AB7V42_08160 [Thermoleophilia bacterium]
MPHLTRQELTARRANRRRRELRRDRRALIWAAIPVAVVVLLAIIMSLTSGADDAPAPLAAPVQADAAGGARPPEVTIARGEGVEVNLPVDPDLVTAAMFHPVSDPGGVEMTAAGGLSIRQADRDGRSGPAAAGLDVGAPAGTTVYSPVDGVIVSVSDYTVRGQIQGYELAIAPETASTGVLLRLSHLEGTPNGERPVVGTAVQAGVTPLGRIRDFSKVGPQELSDYTSDSGNHVHMELVRTDATILP